MVYCAVGGYCYQNFVSVLNSEGGGDILACLYDISEGIMDGWMNGWRDEWVFRHHG